MKFGDVNIEWLGHASFKIRGSKLIYTDPYKIRDTEKADIILITHEHFDHLSPDDIQKIRGPKTMVIAPADCVAKIGGTVKAIKPGQAINIDEVVIEAVPSYNIGKNFHPKQKNWVGYVIEMSGKRIYQAGDTDVIPEMDNIKADIALLPIGGTYTMTAEEAALACEKIKPTYAIPMHYGSIVGSKQDAERFKSKMSGTDTKVVIP
jgi:L-ascorbate metabolism protein UlaG (beta-lactamase superfamily)